MISKHRFEKEGEMAEEAYIREYTLSLRKHITAVQEHGRKMGIDELQLQQHDQSKWDRDEEFLPYAYNFHGPGKGKGITADYARAWLRHLHLNPHHWQHFLFSDGWTPDYGGSGVVINGALEMPEPFAMEMVADWHGASFTYTGSLDIGEWLEKNMNTIRLHPKTADFLRDTLSSCGYGRIVNMHSWAHEL